MTRYDDHEGRILKRAVVAYFRNLRVQPRITLYVWRVSVLALQTVASDSETRRCANQIRREFQNILHPSLNCVFPPSKTEPGNRSHGNYDSDVLFPVLYFLRE